VGDLGVAFDVCASKPHQQELPEPVFEGGVQRTDGGATDSQEGEGKEQ
jgi:hypothetical protein